jgi:Rod binding domain-containing protein
MAGVILSTVAPLPGTDPQIGKHDDPAKIRDAAQQFEALLLAQVLQSAHDGGGWLGSGEDSSGSCASGFAEQQLALTMARQGGFGLAGLISKGLQK